MTFITRGEWGARPPDLSKIGLRSVADITLAVIHYADAVPPAEPSPDLGDADNAAKQQARGIQNFHMDVRQWGDIAYSRLVTPEGDVLEGRPLGQVPAATLGFNVQSIAYCVLTDGPITDAAKDALVLQMHADLAPVGHFFQHVKTHRECDPTFCPGDQIAAWVDAGYPMSPSPQPVPVPPEGPCSALPPGPPPAGHPFLALGATGSAVASFQGLLAVHGFPPGNSHRPDGTWDGIFGPATQAAVEQLQFAHGLTVDGKVGRQTWCALGVR